MSTRRLQFKIISLAGSARRENIVRQFKATNFEWSFLTH